MPRRRGSSTSRADGRGDQDRVLPAHHLDEATRLLPHAQSHVFAGTGHMPQIERADEFAFLLSQFIDSIPVRST